IECGSVVGGMGSQPFRPLAPAMESMKNFLFIGCLVVSACGNRHGAEVHLALQPPSTNNYPSHFAQWLGFYQQEGVQVSISQIAGASKVLEALVCGSADVAGGVY